ncbi:isoprenylcysteine carboxylmethyltransferase family protein [Leifsonia sp. ZF2019]|uniref:methyltransferase family protein n=1 Tax=Leifsonia sp. ZF2019 TaxID=2781978 RepID=UPI0023775069|nr:isoprenylcysteine carboxylmethyltransferase family protein [Leifsonia sp. ZF2019]
MRSATVGSLDPIAVAVLDIPLFVGASALAAAGVRVAVAVATGWTVVVTAALALFATVTGEAGWGVLLMIAAAGCSVAAACAVLLGRLPAEWLVRGPFAFRPARVRRSVAAHVAATFGQIVLFWGLFLVVLPFLIAAAENRWGLRVPLPSAVLVPVGVALLVLMSALGIWAAIAMSTRGGGTPLPAAMPNRLVVAGPYRLLRNPMALAGIAQGVAVGLLVGSWLVLAYAIAGSLVWNYLVRPFEELDLEERFGGQFVRYRAQVRCWLPRLTPWSPAPESVHSP